MHDSIQTYGLPMPQIIFTDNMADKQMLERHFESLKDGVRPFTKHDNLPLLEIPSTVDITLCKSTSQIQSAILTLIDSLSDEDDSTLVVGLDSEWDVDIDARRQGLPDRRQTAILQIAHEDHIWIFQVCFHLYHTQICSWLWIHM